MNKESFLINLIKNKFIGDDGAVIGKWVYSSDIFAENSHFKRNWLGLKEIGYKAMIVNISDAIAMNADAKYALVALSLPRSINPRQIEQIYIGIDEACERFGVKIIGGDTISSDKISIAITIISHTKKPIFRSGARAGDLIAFTGDLGESLKNLKTLKNGGQIGTHSRFKRPILKDKFMQKAGHFINSAMDISDGLGVDMAKLVSASKLGVKFKKRLPKSTLNSGEEYELLFTFAPKNLQKMRRIAQKTRTKINIFAKAMKGKFKYYARNHHF
ncbi:thiamine-phosphate kinase [Campylobacter sp. faydin G-140]|uniref:thiamine-phosphate kinase n=1 Tax=Campylobacter anatolicus TaxID=2829105 RepID=UPI001B9BE34D|nr:thiamine-phosphate kinase [Campylobacter anatolicus]MBR8465999.1 thiamine-phosphate kinase [Campylobacter anatolicus]